MKIIQKVLIKQVITKKSKEKLYGSFSKEVMRLEQECQQLLFEQKKVEAKTNFNKAEIKRRFQKEISGRKKKIELLEFKKEQLNLVDLGSEIVESEVEALVEVAEGMNWGDFQKEKAIVIKDEKVIRIDH